MELSQTGERDGAASGMPRILRNASYLLVAQLLVAPLSIVINAVAARALGADQYGIYYQALTFASFAFLFVEWGQPALLTAQVATHRDRAGELLGSGVASRLSGAVIAVALVPAIVLIAGYDRHFVLVLLLALFTFLLGTVSGACQDVYRGYERTDVAAATLVGAQLLGVAVIVPTLLLGGGLHGLMVAQIFCAGVGVAVVLAMLPRLKVPRLTVRAGTVRELWWRGHPFFVFSLVLALQPLIETVMLSKLAGPEEMGWYGAARKLTGMLIFPASALLAALYPALCRLRVESETGFRSTATEALNVVAIAAVPIALGCGLYPEIGVGIFGLDAYAPTEDNLRILAFWLLLAYFSMPIGSALTAAGRQRGWTLALLAGVVTSALLNPFLIRWFHEATGNGGLGVCVAALIGEVVIVAGASSLLPKGFLAGLDTRRLLKTLLAGGVMCSVALISMTLNSWISAACSLLSYVLCLRFTGAVDLSNVRAFLATLRR